MRTLVTIHTDGACEPNPGPGGWSAIIDIDGSRIELAGGEPITTNNRMEIMAAIVAIEHLDAFGMRNAVLYTDSQYVQRGISIWIHKWKRTHWKKGTVRNRDLWERLDAACQRHSVTFKWVRGHNGDPLNERCDFLAVQQIGKSGASTPLTIHEDFAI